MDRFPPELLHIVASFLSIQDAKNFRLVNENLSVIAGARILPEVSFYLHEKDLKRLRAIAGHPVFAPNVTSLTYFAQVLESPPLSFEKFLQDHGLGKEMELMSPGLIAPWKRELSHSQLQSHYEGYKQMVASQDELAQ
ncbi:hypothetical protein BJ170DRAFT_222970 [Xylariales sp. AK1849]|nr:hypothetical protein BJ170DRAFT_222970 [Xylariales sp. AK1849]